MERTLHLEYYATEHLALRAWGGNGAVQLLRADPRRFALLLERLEPRDLTTIDALDACVLLDLLLLHCRLKLSFMAATPLVHNENHLPFELLTAMVPHPERELCLVSSTNKASSLNLTSTAGAFLLRPSRFTFVLARSMRGVFSIPL